MFRSTSYLNKAYLRKKWLFGACHVSIMSYYMSWPHVMMSWPGYNWPQQVSQVRVKLFFAWILMLSPYFRYCFHFRDWIFAQFYFYHFYVLTGYWNVILVLKWKYANGEKLKNCTNLPVSFLSFFFFFSVKSPLPYNPNEANVNFAHPPPPPRHRYLSGIYDFYRGLAEGWHRS